MPFFLIANGLSAGEENETRKREKLGGRSEIKSC